MLFLILLRIFLARIIDVSLGTFRTILTVKEKIYIPSLIAFFEVIIWFYVAREALVVNDNSILVPVAYSLGYAAGTLIGSCISKHLISGYYEVKIFNHNKKVISYLKKINSRYFIIGNKLVITYLNKKEILSHINAIHNLSKKSIIYTGETKKYKTFININNILQRKNNVL